MHKNFLFIVFTLLLLGCTGLPAKHEIVKTIENSKNVTFPRLNYVFCHRHSYLMAYLKIRQRNNKYTVARYRQFKD